MLVFGVVLIVLGVIYDLSTCQADDDGFGAKVREWLDQYDII